MRWCLGLALWQGAGRAINRRLRLNRASDRRCSVSCIDRALFSVWLIHGSESVDNVQLRGT